MKKTIGILGGMGPLATADLFRKIVVMTRADSDNDHIRIFIDNNAAIPDRTAAILRGGKDPTEEMASALRNLEKCGADCVIVPCNTAHYFIPRLQEMTDIPILNMLEITAREAAKRVPGKKGAILATTGTLSTGLYDRALAAAGVETVVPDEAQRKTLMYLIYEVVKASRPLAEAAEPWAKLLDELRGRGADYFILGCTELPILADSLDAPGPFIDPTAELAAAAIRFCGYEVKR